MDGAGDSGEGVGVGVGEGGEVGSEPSLSADVASLSETSLVSDVAEAQLAQDIALSQQAQANQSSIVSNILSFFSQPLSLFSNLAKALAIDLNLMSVQPEEDAALRAQINDQALRAMLSMSVMRGPAGPIGSVFGATAQGIMGLSPVSNPAANPATVTAEDIAEQSLASRAAQLSENLSQSPADAVGWVYGGLQRPGMGLMAGLGDEGLWGELDWKEGVREALEKGKLPENIRGFLSWVNEVI